MKIALFLWCFLCIQLELVAQGRIMPDTTGSIASIRAFDNDAIQDNYGGVPIYNYDEDPQKADNVITRLWLLIKKKFREFLGRDNLSFLGKIWRYLLIIIAILGISYHLIRSQNVGFFGRNVDKSLPGKVVLEEEIGSKEELHKLLSEAEKSGDFRLSVRILFLLCLHDMADNQIIEWEPDMTNHQILNQINQTSVRIDFSSLVSIYEHVWYGEYTIDSEEYRAFKEEFKTFSSPLTTGIV